MRSVGQVVVLLGVVLFSLSARAQGSPWDPAQIRMEARELAAAGVSPGTVRLSIGVEDAADLLADLKQALV